MVQFSVLVLLLVVTWFWSLSCSGGPGPDGPVFGLAVLFLVWFWPWRAGYSVLILFLLVRSCPASAPVHGPMVVLLLVDWFCWSSCSGGPGRWLGGSVVCSVLVLVLVLVLLAGWLFRPGPGPVVFLGLCTVQFSVLLLLLGTWFWSSSCSGRSGLVMVAGLVASWFGCPQSYSVSWLLVLFPVWFWSWLWPCSWPGL